MATFFSNSLNQFQAAVGEVGDAVAAVTTNAKDMLVNADQLIQAGQTEFEVIADNGLVKLRRYLPLQEESIDWFNGESIPVAKQRKRVPFVFVPPLAVNMLIYDLFPNRSYVKYLLARGYEVYMLDWGAPQKEHAHYDFQTYVGEFMPEFLSKVREHSGVEELTIHGWSMGGVFCLLYPSLTGDSKIKNIISVAAPVNSHASGPQGKIWNAIFDGPAKWVREYTDFRVHNLSPALFSIPGWANAVGFKLTTPVASLQGYWDLLMNLDDRDYVVKHSTMAAFLDKMVAYPGGIMQDMTIRVWMDNQFKQRRMVVGGKEVEIGQCKSSLLTFGGRGDAMVHANAAKGALDIIASNDKEFVLAPGGHMGVLAGSKAFDNNWKITADWLDSRSN